MLQSTSIGGSGRILIVTPQPFYEDRGTPIAVKYVAQALSELGAQVDVLAFPIGSDVNIANVHVTRSDNPFRFKSVPVGFSWRKLVLDASLWQRFTDLVHGGRYELVHAVEEAAYMASVICPHVGIPFIYDMASAIPVEMARKRLFGWGPMQMMLRRMELHVMRFASRIVCSSGLTDYVNRQAPEANVRAWLYPAFSQRVEPARIAALRAELGIEAERRVLLFSGNLAGYQGMDLLLDAFDRARRIRPELLLVCVGATERDLNGRMRRDYFHREGVRIIGRQPRSRMPVYLGMADLLALPRTAVDNVPLKLFDYMAAGKPIIATRGPAHEPLLNNSRAFMADPDPQSFAGAIVKACESPARANAVAGAAQAYARQNFGWDRFVEFVRVTYCDALNEVQELRRLVA